MFFYIRPVLFLWAVLANKPTPCFSVKSFYPCNNTSKLDSYTQFLYNHVHSGTPETLDQNKWQAFIKKIGTCNRTTQSFIPFDRKEQVNNVCSPSGGKAYDRNLCISKQTFFFTTVSLDNNCVVKRVINERKHLILACNNVDNLCRPVHFEANPNDVGPDDKNPDCQRLSTSLFYRFILKRTPVSSLSPFFSDHQNN